MRKDKHNVTSGSSVCLIFNSKLKCCLNLLPQEFLHLEILYIVVNFNKFKHRYIVLYRSPDVNSDYTIKSFECLNLLCNVHSLCYVCDDFNLPNVNWFNKSNGEPAAENCSVNFISHNGLNQLMLSPTHGDNIINLLISNDKHSVFNVELQPLFSNIDHAAVNWQTQRPIVTHDSNKAAHNFACADYNSLEKYFNDIDWLALFLPVPPNDVNGLWHIFKKIVCKSIDLHVPMSFSNNVKYPTYPCLIRLAFNKKRALWHKRNSNLGQKVYKLQAKKCYRLLKQHFSHVEQRLLNKGPNKAFHKYVNKKLCASQFLATLKDSTSNIFIDNLSEVNKFNAHFAFVFQPNINTGSDVNTRLDDNKSNTSQLNNFSPSVVYKS